MASNVVVIDAAAKRYVIKTTPGKHLSEVLEEACSKFGVNATQYGLKHNNKQIDLSKPIRLSGLSSGAKLELVQLSKSAGVVSIALQLPESEARGVPNARLTHKFPSSTTLWQLLRSFEAGVAGGSETRNLTARGIPSTSQGDSGAGRLYYEQPVIHIMNRELASLTDLQKSLAQLGFNTGTALLRLNFRATETPLEEAMAQIEEYFTSIDGPPPPYTSESRPAAPPSETAPAVSQEQPEWMSDISAETADQPQPESITSSSSQPSTATSATGRPISVFRPPTATTPSAALIPHNDADYNPTIEHAQTHQRQLGQNTINKRLKSEAELASQADEDAARWAAVKHVDIRIRFPDQSVLGTKFEQADTGSDLYSVVRDGLEEQWRSESFALRIPGIQGKKGIVPDDVETRLIKDLQLHGRVLLTFTWDDQKASVEARGTRSVLKPTLMKEAEELKAPNIPGLDVDDANDPGVKVNVDNKEPKPSENDDQGKKKMPKWLKGLNKK